MRRSRMALSYAVIGLLTAVGCQEESPVPTVADEVRLLEADQVTIGGRHYFTQEGIRAATLHFDTVYQWRDSVNWHMREPNLTVYNDDGSERARVTSRRGVINPRADQMIAREQVVLVVPGQDRRVETEELHYDPEGGRIWGDSAFVMYHEGRILRGSSFTSDLEFRNFRVLGPGGRDP